MKPIETLGWVRTSDSRHLVLYRREDDYQIRLDGLELMTSRAFGSEAAMAELVRSCLGGVVAPRVLVGGLGMGFTLRAALDCFGASATVEVAEVFPEVVTWNRGPLAHLASRPLEDPRVVVHETDVTEVLGEGNYDGILLDVDNGPSPFTLDSNAELYYESGIELLVASLTPAGALAVWSSDDAPNFERRLRDAGLEVRREPVPACGKDGGPDHTIYLARRPAQS